MGDMKDGWQPIETAPKDGSKVWVRRSYNDGALRAAWAVWGPMGHDAPMRTSSAGGLYATIPADNAYADIPAWCTEDMRYHVPTPTEWRPDGPV